MRTSLIVLLILLAATTVTWVLVEGPVARRAIVGLDSPPEPPAVQPAPEVVIEPLAPPDRARDLTGRVRRWEPSQGRWLPYPGVRLRLASSNDQDLHEALARGVSNDDGAFRLEDVPSGAHRLAAFPPGDDGPVLVSLEMPPPGATEPEPVLLSFGAPPGEVVTASAPAFHGPSPEGPDTETLVRDAVAWSSAQRIQWTSAEGKGTTLEVTPLLQGSGEPVHYELVSDGSSAAITLSMLAVSSRSARTQAPERQQDPERGEIRGSVTDSTTGAPLARARVRLVGLSSKTTTSDAEGRFSFAGVREGEYAVTLAGLQGASIFRHTPGNAIISVAPGQVVEVALRAQRRLRIQQVFEGTQAEAAGLQIGDELLTYGGVVPQDESHLRKLRSAVPEKEEVTVEVERQGARLAIPLHGSTIGISTEVIYR